MCLKLVSSSVTLDQEGGVVLVLLRCAHLLNTDHPVQINKPERGREGGREEGGKDYRERKEGRRERGKEREREGGKKRWKRERKGWRRERDKYKGGASSFESKSSPEVL